MTADMDNRRLISYEEVTKRFPLLEAVSGSTIHVLGPAFTETPAGHIQTDIAATSSMAGLILLQETVGNLEDIITKTGAGNVVLSEIHDGQDTIFRFMYTFAVSNGLEGTGASWKDVPQEQYPLLSCEEMTRRLAPTFYELCEKQKLDREYWKLAAAMAAVRLIISGRKVGILDPNIGRAIAAFYVVAGSKTIPFKEALWHK
jgi:hypothetical protein